MNKTAIGTRLRTAREALGLSGADAARELGVSPQALSNYERGFRIPKDDTKSKFCKLFKKSYEELFFAD